MQHSNQAYVTDSDTYMTEVCCDGIIFWGLLHVWEAWHSAGVFSDFEGEASNWYLSDTGLACSGVSAPDDIPPLYAESRLDSLLLIIFSAEHKSDNWTVITSSSHFWKMQIMPGTGVTSKLYSKLSIKNYTVGKNYVAK